MMVKNLAENLGKTPSAIGGSRRAPGGLRALFGRCWHMRGRKTVMPTTGRCDGLAAWLALLAILFAGVATERACGQVLDAAGTPALPIAPMPSATVASPAENQNAISFAAAMSLVARQNPQIAFANEQVHEAFAQLRGAQVLWLPAIRAGVGYIKHDGPLQAGDGTVPVASRSAVEAGLGMYAVGGGAPSIPGVSAKFAFADAIFQPRIADQEVAARRHAAKATTNDLLLFVAVAYLDLLRAFQQQAIAQETLNHTAQLAELTMAFARTGQGNQADADRAKRSLWCGKTPWRRPSRKPTWPRPGWWNCCTWNPAAC